MKNILSFSISLILFTACQQSTKKEIKIYHCDKGITAMNLDSLPLYKSFSDYEAFLQLDENVNKSKIKGEIIEITEYHYKKSTKYDEETLTPILESNIQYNEFNHSTITKSKYIPNGKEYISQENVYTSNGIINSEGKFDDKYMFLYSYIFSTDGVLVSKKSKIDTNPTNVNDRKMLYQNWDNKISYYYENTNQLSKETQSTLYLGKFIQDDSTVVKYKYIDAHSKLPDEIIKYNKNGDRSTISYVSYDSILNNLVIRTWRPWGTSYNGNNGISDKNLLSELVIAFDENCQVTGVTNVEIWIKNMKRYSKLEFNEKGDLTSWSRFIYPKKSETDYDLTYLKEFDYQYKLESDGKYFDYTYDKMGNWIERKEGDDVIKRKIIYR